MPSASSVPAPDTGDGVKKPGPSIVPAQPVKKRGNAMWGIALAVAVLAGGTGLYLKNQSQSKTSGGGPVVTVATVAVGLGDLNASLRVNGTVAAQSFAALLAPRITGSR